MNGIALLKSRNASNNIIVAAFVDKVLTENAARFKRAQDRVFSQSNHPTVPHVRDNRTFIVSNGTLTHTHAIEQRFIDMKRVRYGRQKPVQGHNAPLYRTWNDILFELRYGLTESVRASLIKKLEIPA